MRLPRFAVVGALSCFNRRGVLLSPRVFKKLKLIQGAVVIGLLIVCAGWHFSRRIAPPVVRKSLPPVILWAWERPEDLSFIDTNRVGVAFLAQTLILENDEVVFRPRRQPLKVPPSTVLIAVTRIEPVRSSTKQPAFSQSQLRKLVSLVIQTTELDNISAVQIDFDVAKSERLFYRHFLHALRDRLPDRMPLSMTALASFCIGDRWLEGLPVDEIVPMVFRMGLDSQRVKTFLADGNDFREPLCRNSFGVALDEPVEMSWRNERRLYVFNNSGWTSDRLGIASKVYADGQMSGSKNTEPER